MDRYPKLVLNLGRIAENTARVVGLCASAGIEIAAVTKGACADFRVVRAMYEGGCASFADSRVQNLARLKKFFPAVPRTLIRIPMRSELPRAIRYAGRSLVSMAESAGTIADRCLEADAGHGVILMFDLGDRREGILDGLEDRGENELEAFAEAMKSAEKKSRVTLSGVGANFGCFAGALPGAAELRRLCRARDALAMLMGHGIPVCSGGSTSSLALIERGEMPEGVTELRVGEAILLGQDISRQRVIPWLRQDTAYLEAEVVEARYKPSLPGGEIGADGFGNRQVFADEGVRRRVIVAVGRQDAPIEGLAPLDAGVRVLGGSSDHTILSVDGGEGLEWGEVARFSVNYAAFLGLMTSPYVFKEYSGLN